MADEQKPIDPKIFLEPEPTERQKVLYDAFIKEFALDFNPIQATCRVGFNLEFCEEQAKRLMSAPYVQRAIAKMKTEKAPENEADEISRDKTRIVAALRGALECGDPKVAVAASKVLAGIRGIDQAPDRSGDELERVVDFFKKIATNTPD